MKTLLKVLVSVSALVQSVQALGYGMTHQYFAQTRAYATGNVYLSQQVQMTKSENKVEMKEAGQYSGGSFDGYSLRTSAGVEHLRLLQTGIFYSSLQESQGSSSLNELRASEYGAEAKLCLTSPLVNVNLGGGVFMTSGSFRGSNEPVSLSGNGYFAGAELAYYTSNRMNFVISATQMSSKMVDKSAKSAIRSLQSTSLRLGAGISLWL